MAFRLSKIGGFSVATGNQYLGTLAPKLAPCVDQIRDLYTKFGMRPYTVNLVHTRSAGGARGYGVEQVISVVPVLPTPKIESISSLDMSRFSVGGDESGSLRVSQISTRFTEAQLLGRTDNDDSIPDDLNFFYEIAFTRNGLAPTLRRMYPSSVPQLSPGGFEWEIQLTRSNVDRAGIGAHGNREG